jgi:hypothetical protein
MFVSRLALARDSTDIRLVQVPGLLRLQSVGEGKLSRSSSVVDSSDGFQRALDRALSVQVYVFIFYFYKKSHSDLAGYGGQLQAEQGVEELPDLATALPARLALIDSITSFALGPLPVSSVAPVFASMASRLGLSHAAFVRLTSLLVTVGTADSVQTLLMAFTGAFLNERSLEGPASLEVFTRTFGRYPLVGLPQGGVVVGLRAAFHAFLLVVLDLMNKLGIKKEVNILSELTLARLFFLSF